MDPVLERFAYRQPTPEIVHRIELFRDSLRNLADWLASQPMEPRCRALTMTKLEEASMWGNKGFVFAGGPEQPPAQEQEPF